MCNFLEDFQGEVSRGDTTALRGTDPELYITEYTLVYEEEKLSSG